MLAGSFQSVAIQLALALTLSAVGSAQQIPKSQEPGETVIEAGGQELPTFKSQHDLVLVPVVVRDKKGGHMKGLGKEAFQVEENGKQQDITLFEEVRPVQEMPALPHADLGYSNLPLDSAHRQRLTILVLDLINTSPLQRADARDQILKFVSNGLAPNQPVSVLCLTTRGLKQIQPFTMDQKVLIDTLKKLSLGAETIIGHENSVFMTIQQLKEIGQSYGGIAGRKSMILAGAYLRELAIDPGREISNTYQLSLGDMAAALINANIAVYPLELLVGATDPTVGGLRSRAQDLFLKNFASDTGGNVCFESNGANGCLMEAVEDSQSYYMLGFAVRPNDRKPGWRDLKVKVEGEHGDIEARGGFFYGKTEPQPNPDPKAARADEVSALGSALPKSDVPMYVKVLGTAPATVTDGAHAREKKTTVSFRITVPLGGVKIDTSKTNPLDLEVGAIAITSKTKEGGEILHAVRGSPKPENLQAWRRYGIEIPEKIDLSAGSYDMRFFVHDMNGGQIGTVVFPLDVQ